MSNLLAYVQPDNTIDFNQNAKASTSIKHGVYVALKSMERGIYFSPTNNFEYLDNYYLLDDFEELVLESFKQSKSSLASLYLGLKGSGKTKRAHKLALDSGMPVLIINDLSIINNQQWNDIVGSNVLNNWVVFIDEYEKKLRDDNSVALLNWLDGSVNTKQLFILIGNEEAHTRYTDPLVDRLSRVLWKKEFKPLTDNDASILVNKLSIREDKAELIDLLSNIPVLSMDNTLQIIKITNMFPSKSIEAIVTNLNISFKAVEDFILVDESGVCVTEDEDTLGLIITKNGALPSRAVEFMIDSEEFINNYNKANNKSIYKISIDIPKNLKLTKISRHEYKFSVPYSACANYEEYRNGTWTKEDNEITIYLYRYNVWRTLSKFPTSFYQLMT